MMGTVIPNIIGIASNICLFASFSPMPPISIAKTPPIKPAIIISTFINNRTKTTINGIITTNAMIPVGATTSPISSAKAATGTKILTKNAKISATFDDFFILLSSNRKKARATQQRILSALLIIWQRHLARHIYRNVQSH